MKYCSVQISELRRRGKQLERENNALSQQNAKHALSVDTLQHTLEEVMLHHGNGSSNERSEVSSSALKIMFSTSAGKRVNSYGHYYEIDSMIILI